MLIHHNYFQHNIIEAGAHYADFPWRPVNNINHTGFPEPINFAADKRLFMADQFYDENNPARRGLHQAFIDQCLNNFKDNHNVIQFICEEFTGPTHFVRFWLETIRDWEKKNNQTGRDAPFIGLSTTKDVQDSILADPALNKLIKVIDIRYWYYQQDGTLYAPKGGQSLAPRQWARILKPKNTNFAQVYRAVRQYKDKYPDKAVMYSAKNAPELAWASFMAGGSLPDLPADLPGDFLAAATQMHPMNPNNNESKSEGISKNEYILGSSINKAGNASYITYLNKGAQMTLPPKAASEQYLVKAIDPKTGQVVSTKQQKGGNVLTALRGDMVYWLQAK